MTELCRLCRETAEVQITGDGLWIAVDGCRCAGFDASQRAWERLPNLTDVHRQELSDESRACHEVGGRLRILGTLHSDCRQPEPTPRLRAT
jgi:hypothetical protein